MLASILPPAVLLLGGCGGGLLGLSELTGSDGGTPSNAPTVLSGLTIENPKTAETCRIQFRLSDPEMQEARVQLFVAPAGEPATALVGLADGNPRELATSPDGEVHSLAWDFRQEPDLSPSGALVPDVLVYATVSGGVQQPLEGTNAVRVALGNDPPVVGLLPPDEDEGSGVVLQRILISDSSFDALSVRVSYRIDDGSAPGGWIPARPASVPAGEPTPEFAFVDLTATPLPQEVVFFWDTEHDLGLEERDVQLRFQALDGVAEGALVETPVFRVDNNAEPIVFLEDGLLLLNPDRRRGLPVPFELVDEEGDQVRLVFQWRRPGESFPELGSTPAEILALLADPEARRAHRVCSAFGVHVGGRLSPVDATHVRLPELLGSGASVLPDDLTGRTLELLRPPGRFEAVDARWPENPLTHPVAALLLDAGVEALVLDRSAPDAWRLARVRLATGASAALVESSAGEPWALCWEVEGRSVLVAHGAPSGWRVDRFELESGTIATVAEGAGGTVRGIAALGRGAALLTADTRLIRADYDGTATIAVSTLFDDLEAPRGVAVDRRDPRRAVVAERGSIGGGRVTEVDLVRLERRTSIQSRRDADALFSPLGPALSSVRPIGVAMAEQPHGLHLLYESDGSERVEHAWFALDPELGIDADRRSKLPRGAASISADAGSAVILTRADPPGLLVAGGVEQRRAIVAHELPQAIVQVPVDAPFDPLPRAGQPWRVARGTEEVPGSANGRAGLFVWDTSDVPGGGSVLLRALPIDSEIGTSDETTAQREVAGLLDPVPRTTGGAGLTDGSSSVLAVDVDLDGDLDLVSANRQDDTLTVLLQIEPWEFDEGSPIFLGSGVLDGPVALVAGDLDRDGWVDLVCANRDGDELSLFYGVAPASFEPAVRLGRGTLFGPTALAAGDLEGDGLLDLVVASPVTDDATIFRQTSPRVFQSETIGSPAVTDAPSAIVLGDLDRDGRVDVALANEGGDDVALFLQTPTGFDETPSQVIGTGRLNGPADLEAADLDRDGDLDLAVANRAGDDLSVLFQGAPGDFEQEPSLTLGGQGLTNGPRSVAIGDIDGDGRLDVVCANEVGGSLAIFFQDGTGGFEPAPETLDPPGPFAPTSLSRVDLDRDGNLDLLCTDPGQSLVHGFATVGAGGFDAEPLAISGDGAVQGPWSLVAADVDGDGDLELLSGNSVGGDITIFDQIGPGIFDSGPRVVGAPGLTTDSRALLAHDLDGDGDLDLVSANTSPNQLRIFLQGPAWTFAPLPPIGDATLTAGPFALAAADLDGDGRTDLVSANSQGDDLTVFFQDASGGYGERTLTLGDEELTRRPRAVEAVDLDRDGDVDLVTANQLGNDLRVLSNEGDGSFAPGPRLGGAGITAGPWALAVGDVNGDGGPDIVSANLLGGDLTVFFQTSPGRFGEEPLVLSSPGFTDGARAVDLADLDADGDLDVVSANGVARTLTAFLQIGPRRFRGQPLVLGNAEVTSSPTDVLAIDVDGDGDVDLVTDHFTGDVTEFDGLRVFWGAH